MSDAPFTVASTTDALPSIKITSSPEANSSGEVNLKQGDKIVVTGVPSNVGTDYTRNFFFGPIFNAACTINSEWVITCTATGAGTSDFYIDVSKGGQVYRSNVIKVKVASSAGAPGATTPTTITLRPSRPSGSSRHKHNALRMRTGKYLRVYAYLQRTWSKRVSHNPCRCNGRIVRIYDSECSGRSSGGHVHAHGEEQYNRHDEYEQYAVCGDGGDCASTGRNYAALASGAHCHSLHKRKQHQPKHRRNAHVEFFRCDILRRIKRMVWREDAFRIRINRKSDNEQDLHAYLHGRGRSNDTVRNSYCESAANRRFHSHHPHLRLTHSGTGGHKCNALRMR